ncbi:beta-alanine-activating enzyme [Protopterus annectens]|uniref:beta-alanine-activating enzyme n=1 Tax=Protopterus annectens TaxID=7888 RepID=UPI001CFA46A5|nr:beta-alanine-activating enzyme [Protopterus annectens]
MATVTLHGMVLQAAACYSDRKAVCFDYCDGDTSVSYTYSTVLRLAKELTTCLQQHCRLSDCYAVGVYCHLDINLPSWILGILQVPAAYAPVDPGTPPSLSACFMKKSHLKYILVQKGLLENFRHSFSPWLHCDSVSTEIVGVTLLFIQWKTEAGQYTLRSPKRAKAKLNATSEFSEQKPKASNHTKCMDWKQPGCLAYILHTSGTTGMPKIVRVPHTCIVPNIQHLRSLFEMTPEDVVFMASSLTFDPSVVELFVALGSGASLLILPAAIKMIPSKLADILLNHHRVTVLQATPTLLRRFGTDLMKTTVLSADTSLRILAIGGETFPTMTALKSWREERNRTQIFNLYGVTEVSCWATYNKIPTEGFEQSLDIPIPLGYPLLETLVEVQDSDGCVVKEGVGQIYLGGNHRVCFLDDEVSVPLGTMRETGDWAEVKSGQMYFIGRTDSQIKRHGKRLNLGSVQQAAESLSYVEACAVFCYEQSKLILFVVMRTFIGTNVEREILQQLSQLLPSHEIPDDVVLVEALPCTSHGKVDISELTRIYQKSADKKSTSVPLEKQKLWTALQNTWQVILNLPVDASSVPEDSQFLYSGGDSLKSLRLVKEMENLVGKSISGLLEVILTKSFSEVYNHISEFLFPNKNDSIINSLKRKPPSSHQDHFHLGIQKRSKAESVPAVEEHVDLIVINRGCQERKICTCLSCKDGFKKSELVQEGLQGQNLSTALLVDYNTHRNNKTEISDCMNSDRQVRNVSSMTKTSETLKITCAFSDVTDKQLNSTKPAVPPKELTAAKNLSLQVKWQTHSSKCVDASPLLVMMVGAQTTGTVYIGSHSKQLQAVDLFSGLVKWERILGDRIEASACSSRCGGFVIVGCYDGNVYILQSHNGELNWTFSTGNSVKSSATVDSLTGLVFVGSHDHHLYALNIQEQKCSWKQNCGGALFSSPFLNLSPRLLYAATLGGVLLSLNPDEGSIIWKQDCGKPLFSSPQCTQTAVCVGCVDCNIYCFSHAGEKLWQFATCGPVFSSPCFKKLTVPMLYCGSHDNFVYCLNIDGKLVWKFKTSSKVYATPFVFTIPNLYYGPLVTVASTDGNVWVLDAETGELKASHLLPGEVFSSPVLWERRLIVGCRNDYVYCLELSPATQE